MRVSRFAPILFHCRHNFAFGAYFSRLALQRALISTGAGLRARFARCCAHAHSASSSAAAAAAASTASTASTASAKECYFAASLACAVLRARAKFKSARARAPNSFISSFSKPVAQLECKSSRLYAAAANAATCNPPERFTQPALPPPSGRLRAPGQVRPSARKREAPRGGVAEREKEKREAN